MSLENSTIVITGAASGIGRATALYLASRGARTGLIDITEPSAVASEIAKTHGADRVLAVACDVRSTTQVNLAIQTIVDTFGPLHGAANLAGVMGRDRIIGTKMGQLKEMEDDEWNRVIDINLNGVKNCMRAELHNFSSEGGSIVNAASVAGLAATPYNSAYAVSKAGVISLTKSVSKETGGDGIRVNAISPGVVNTPLIVPMINDNTKEAFMTQTNALGRAAEPLEVAKLIEFLLSSDSSYCTGAVYSIDGGW